MVTIKKQEEKNKPFIIFGLGNPGREYENTRHNIGFLAVDKLSEEWQISISRLRFQALVGEGRYQNQRILLVKPQMYMNNSGNAVRSLKNFFKIEPESILVIHDELDLPFGSLRLRKSGGSAGHRGMESIISSIGSSDFPRLRIGIGRPPGKMEPMKFVLRKFTDSMQNDVQLVLQKVVRAVEVLLTAGIDRAMTQFNHSVFEDEQ